jgi:hypothetical protein
MSNNLKVWLQHLLLTEAQAQEIESYVQWKMCHPEETTNQFESIRSALPGDSQREWTTVQFYIWLYLKETCTSIPERFQKMKAVGFPNGTQLLMKMEWLKANSSTIYYF